MLRLIQREIEKLKKQILELGAMVEERVRMAVKAIEEKRSRPLFGSLRGDWEIDQREVDLEEECLKILALHQPVRTISGSSSRCSRSTTTLNAWATSR